MARSSTSVEVYLEIGKKRTFAGALDWPGWCRSGRDEASALQALLDYGPRYARLLSRARLGFRAPEDVSAFVVTERVKGNATTDFGAPGLAPSFDRKPLSPEDIHRYVKILRASWRAFDAALYSATGKTLRTGPRGGGRQVEGILEHVLGSEMGYLSQLGWKLPKEKAGNSDQELERRRQEILRGLRASARGEIPAKGPRGGIRWTTRYFVRRDAWHILDHAWEIEDRILSE